jgi:hypothetical protein
MSRRKLQLQQKPTRHMLPPTAVSRNGFDWRLVMKPLAACRECKRLAGISAGLLGKIYCVVRMAFQGHRWRSLRAGGDNFIDLNRSRKLPSKT